ncbi:MAG TPA: galactose oxidase-like domain-containing protein [Gemmatimonadales bacterium]|nr:galactose oxidase-like domain-containing protein [Gemmatimonadales bacterium]
MIRSPGRRLQLHAVGLSALALADLGCRDSTRPNTGEPDPILISIGYVCGNRYEVSNANAISVTVGFQVSEGGESGELTLLPNAAAPLGATRLVVRSRGDLRLTYQDQVIAEVANAGITCPPPDSSVPEPAASQGRWDAPFAWPIVAVHLSVLPDGQVLSWGREGNPQKWNPTTGLFVEAPSTTHLFCAGQAFLPDGRLFVAGGHLSDNHGLPDANIFDHRTGQWVRVASMAHGRWYPTATTLPDGTVLVLAGQDESGNDVAEPELWDGGGWRARPGAARTIPFYPRTFVAPNGLVFYAGELPQSSYLDPSGTGRWVPVATSGYGRRDYGTAVMYRPGRVLIVGGSDPPDGVPTASAEVIDLEQASPAWRFTGSMAQARRHLNATVLPDGRVAVTGGTQAAGFSDPAGGVRAVEVWNPETDEWTTWASGAVTRVYHSTTVLLPDGRLLHAGSGDGANLPRELSAELFTPPYLLRGPRPVIDSAPDSFAYGSSVLIGTRDAGKITHASLVRLPSVTHAFDQNQRFVPLAIVRSAGGVKITAPSSGTLAPPGDYMLFLIDDDGVPSTGRMVRLS